MELAQGKETYLPDEDLAALFDVFQKEKGSALAYLSIKTEGVRKAWVKRKIASVMLPPQLVCTCKILFIIILCYKYRAVLLISLQ